jgi:hypothetical protein
MTARSDTLVAQFVQSHNEFVCLVQRLSAEAGRGYPPGRSALSVSSLTTRRKAT